jgi:hypothetical protein
MSANSYKSLMANSKSVRRERSQINGQVSALSSVIDLVTIASLRYRLGKVA